MKSLIAQVALLAFGLSTTGVAAAPAAAPALSLPVMSSKLWTPYTDAAKQPAPLANPNPPPANMPPPRNASDGTPYYLINLATGKKSPFYGVTDGQYWGMIVVGRKGVLVVDSPGAFVVDAAKAVSKETGKKVTHYVYSHRHLDHNGHVQEFKDMGATIVGHTDTARYLTKLGDLRPKTQALVDISVTDEHIIDLGNRKIVLKDSKSTNHIDGNLIIHAPTDDILMFVDVITPSLASFRGIGAAVDIRGVLDSHKEILAHDFKHFIGGHGTLGSRADVQLNYDYNNDVVQFTKEALGSGISFQAVGPLVGKTGNARTVQEAFFALVGKACGERLVEKYGKKLEGVDATASNSCQTAALAMLMYGTL